MYDTRDILIIGDSFCGQRDQTGEWPYDLHALLTGTGQVPRGQGFPGASWWSSRRCLLRELHLHVPEILIMCHTNEYRMPNDHDLGISDAQAQNDHIFVPPTAEYVYNHGILQAARSYYLHLYCREFWAWAADAWYQELESVIRQKNIQKVIHLCSYRQVYRFTTGMVSQDCLFDLVQPGRSGPNHYDTQQNIQLAHSLYNTLTNYTQGSRFVL
jgi:hypothetical protein